jgi:pentatricopeptide repeat protein
LNNKAKVSDLCDQMIEDGIKPNVYTYNTMIRAFSKDASKVDELYRKMIGDGIKPNVYIYSLMIDIYAKSGKMEEVDKMFGSMKKDMITPNVVTYTAMINAYSNDGKFVKAVDLFDLMIAESIEPNVLTYSSMIDIYAKGGRLEKADEMFRLMKKDGMKPDLVTYTTIIDAYAKSGNSEKAIEVFVSFKEDGMKPDFTIYSTILNCYAKSGRHIADMIGIFKEMRESSIVLEIRAWNNLMEGYCRAEGEGDRKKALSIWKYLSGQISHENLGIDLPEKTPCVYPSNVTLSIGLDVCKFGRFEKEADEVWMYGQENEGIVLVSNVLTSYVEALATFSEKGADRVVELIISGMKGEKIPLRCVRPNEKTIANAKRELIDHGWEKHAAMLDGLVIED